MGAYLTEVNRFLYFSIPFYTHHFIAVYFNITMILGLYTQIEDLPPNMLLYQLHTCKQTTMHKHIFKAIIIKYEYVDMYDL